MAVHVQIHHGGINGFEARRIGDFTCLTLVEDGALGAGTGNHVNFYSAHDTGGTDPAARGAQVDSIRQVLLAGLAALDMVDPAKGDQDRYDAPWPPEALPVLPPVTDQDQADTHLVAHHGMLRTRGAFDRLAVHVREHTLIDDDDLGHVHADAGQPPSDADQGGTWPAAPQCDDPFPHAHHPYGDADDDGQCPGVSEPAVPEVDDDQEHARADQVRHYLTPPELRAHLLAAEGDGGHGQASDDLNDLAEAGLDDEDVHNLSHATRDPLDLADLAALGHTRTDHELLTPVPDADYGGPEGDDLDDDLDDDCGEGEHDPCPDPDCTDPQCRAGRWS